MINQFYSASTVEEALNIVKVGGNHIGLSPKTFANLPAELDNPELKEIIDAVDAVGEKCSLLFIDNDWDFMYKCVEETKPHIIHLCGDEYFATPEFNKKIKEISPRTEIMQAIPVVGPEAVQSAIDYSKFCDYLILDSVTVDIPGTGAAGVVHDWNISKEICEKAHCTVVLAGGLGPDNVEEAIRFVRPDGVDSLTKTNATLPNGQRIKDIEKIKEFCATANRVGAELGL